MSKIPLKILYSAVKEPFWKYRAFGLDEKHFHEANRVQCVCDWKNKKGDLEFPWVYEINSNKALLCQSWKKLKLVPISQFDKIELRKDENDG